MDRILIARLSVGVLFALSGWGKLFVRSRREEMVRTLRAAAVPAAEVNAVFVASVEFLFGSLLTIGCFTPLSCVMLSGIMLVALATTVLPAVKASSFVGWLGEVLYLPEVHRSVFPPFEMFPGVCPAEVVSCVVSELCHIPLETRGNIAM